MKVKVNRDVGTGVREVWDNWEKGRRPKERVNVGRFSDEGDL